MAEKRGLFIVIDGLDGVGKGEAERALIVYEQRLGKAVFDSIAFSKAHRKGLPELKDFWNPPETYYDTVITAEPTYSGVGHIIRNEIAKENKRKYTVEAEIEAFSLDRLVQMQRVVIPALQHGLNVIQGRCCASTLTYQSLRAEDEAKNPEEIRKRILSHEGNSLQFRWAPDLLIIPTIKNIDELMKRIEERKEYEKDDKSIFDKKEFQEKLNALYQSEWLRKLFESCDTKVEYIDASISGEETRRQAGEIYKEFLKSRE